MAFDKEAILWMILGAFLLVFAQFSVKLACPKKKQKSAKSELKWDSADETDDEQVISPKRVEGYDTALFASYPIDDLKMMMAVRTDLGMTKGKIGAQCGHATLGSFKVTKKWA